MQLLLNSMRKGFKYKLIAVSLFMAMTNIALFSIINFHQYRIFEKQLLKFDEYFIKKDENYYKTFEIAKNNRILPSVLDYATIDSYTNDIVYCFTINLIHLPFTYENANNQLHLSTQPTRGSPTV